MLFLAVAAFNLANGPAVAASPAPTIADTRSLHLSPGQMFRLAELAGEKQDEATQFSIYAALETHPDPAVRAEARFRHARQLLARHRNRDAGLLLRTLLDERPDAVPARIELARALQLMGDTDGALRELRAAQSSGLPPSVARIVDRYSASLRAQRPYGANFEIALAPDSNINRATRSDTLGTVLGNFDISDEAKARSGTGLSVSAQAFRRFSLHREIMLVLRASGGGDLYRQSRFNNIAFDLAAGPELRIGKDQLQIEVGRTQRWFGQKPFMRSHRIAATLSHRVGSRAQLRLSASASLIDNQLNDLQDGKGYTGRLQVERALTPTTGVAANITYDRQSLTEPAYSTRAWRTGVTAWKDVGRATFTAGVELGRLHADERLALFPERRRDQYRKLSLGVSMRQFQVAGFAPVLRFSVEQNRSNTAFYSYRRSRTEIAIVRAF